MHNSKEIVNIQGLFVLTVGYVDMTTYPLTKYYYIIERVYFIYRLFVLFISTLPFLLLLHAALWRYKRDYLHASINILYYVISTMKKQTLLYHVLSYNTKKVPIWTWPSQPTICSYAPVSPYCCFLYFYISMFQNWELFIKEKTKVFLNRLLLNSCIIKV